MESSEEHDRFMEIQGRSHVQNTKKGYANKIKMMVQWLNSRHPAAVQPNGNDLVLPLVHKPIKDFLAI